MTRKKTMARHHLESYKNQQSLYEWWD